MGAPAARCYEFSRRWVQAGHKVSVVCGIPNHPVGKVYDGYSKKLLHAEIIDGIQVYRSWVYVTPNEGNVRRSFNYLSYGISSVVTSEFIRHVDIVIASSPQFFAAAAGYIVSVLKRIPFVLEVRDLWPDSFQAVDVNIPGFAFHLLKKIERLLYRKAKKIVIVSEAFRNHLTTAGAENNKISTITNGVAKNIFHPRHKSRLYLNGHLKEKFLVSYVGTMGMAHGLETVLESARELADREEIHFVFVGEGAKKEELKSMARTLPNVTFIDRQPRKTIAYILNESDVALVLLRNSPLFKTVIPSKMFEVMGCGRPMILGVEGEAKRILDEAQGGICIEPENAKELTRAVLQFYNDRELCRRRGENAFQYAHTNFDLDILAQRYLHVLHSAERVN